MNLAEVRIISTPFNLFPLVNLTPKPEYSGWEFLTQVQKKYLDQKKEEENFIQQMKDLLTTDVEEARKIAAEAIKKFPHSNVIKTYLKIVEPPRITSRPASGISREKEFKWIRKHRNEYKGQWVALYQDKCLATGLNVAEVKNKAKEQTDLRNILITYLSK